MSFFVANPWYLLLLIVALAFLPTLIALLRQADGITTILLLNALGLVTLVAWPIALVFAFTWLRREDHRTPPHIGSSHQQP